MNILILSGIYPSRKQKFGGSFIEKRYELIKLNNDVDLYSIAYRHRFIYELIYKKIFKKEYIDDINVDNGGLYAWKKFIIKKSISSEFIKKINCELYYKLIAHQIGKQTDIKKYDLIHAHWTFPTGYIAKILSEKYNIPYVVTAHGSDIHTIPKNNKEIAKYTVKVLEKADKAIFVSNELKRQAMQLGYTGNNSTVIYNGVDLEHFKFISKEKIEHIKLELGLSNKVVSYIGRLEEIKGADRLPEIFSQIAKERNDVEFLIVGDGSLKEEILSKLNINGIKFKQLNSVIHNELYKYYNLSNAVVVPSRNESFCCVALEAQACGTNVVASDVGGIKECVGKYGYLIAQGERFEERMAEKVIEILDEDRNVDEMIKRVEDFSWKSKVEEECNVYINAIKRGNVYGK